MVAALFVETNGVYFNVPGVDPWDIIRDARKYHGPSAVIAHPPCERWGRYWSGGPSAKVRRKLGDDQGCFWSAYNSVKMYYGVLEHPEASHAWKAFELPKPPACGGWLQFGSTEYTCQVEQGHYGHRARKKTWLYLNSTMEPPELIWGPSQGERLDEGFHSKEERRLARAAGIKPQRRLSKRENVDTPIPFRDVLIMLARNSRR